MTKRELIETMAGFGDDQHVFVKLLSRDHPRGSQVAIQGVLAVPPWRDSKPDGSNFLIGLVAHAENAEIPNQKANAMNRLDNKSESALTEMGGTFYTVQGEIGTESWCNAGGAKWKLIHGLGYVRHEAGAMCYVPADGASVAPGRPSAPGRDAGPSSS